MGTKITVCSVCKLIQYIKTYPQTPSGVRYSHGYHQECVRNFYGQELYNQIFKQEADYKGVITLRRN